MRILPQQTYKGITVNITLTYGLIFNYYRLTGDSSMTQEERASATSSNEGAVTQRNVLHACKLSLISIRYAEKEMWTVSCMRER